jgi:hypothetical protein
VVCIGEIGEVGKKVEGRNKKEKSGGGMRKN